MFLPSTASQSVPVSDTAPTPLGIPSPPLSSSIPLLYSTASLHAASTGPKSFPRARFFTVSIAASKSPDSTFCSAPTITSTASSSARRTCPWYSFSALSTPASAVSPPSALAILASNSFTALSFLATCTCASVSPNTLLQGNRNAAFRSPNTNDDT